MWLGSSKAVTLPIWIYFAWLHAQAFEVPRGGPEGAIGLRRVGICERLYMLVLRRITKKQVALVGKDDTWIFVGNFVNRKLELDIQNG